MNGYLNSNSIRWRIHLVFIVCVSLISSYTVVADQAVPIGVVYQGRLHNAAAEVVPDGSGYEIEIRLWTIPSGGTTPLWAARYSDVPVKNGAFNIILGGENGDNIESAATRDLQTAFSTAPTTYLGLTLARDAEGKPVSSTSELLPRQQLLSVPYAMQASLLSGKRIDEITPAGTVVAFAGDNPPPDWILCDGRTLSSSTFARLYAAIGETWGDGGDGTGGLFNIPNLLGRTVVGAGTGTQLTPRELSESGGEESHRLSIEELPNHTHEYDVGLSNITRDEDHDIPYSKYAGLPNQQPPFETRGSGSGIPHNNMQPYVVLNYIIKL